jgi:hypothetical protein
VPIACDISYMPVHCRLTGTLRLCARLVRGGDAGRNFELLPPPEGEFHPAALERHEHAYRLYHDNYAEQIAAHEQQFVVAPA